MLIYTNLNAFYRIFIALVIGVVVGIIGMILRLGWEVLFPIFLSDSVMNLDSMSSQILAFLGVSSSEIFLRYVFDSGHEVGIFYLLWQFGFSVSFSLLYVLLVEFLVKIKFAQGLFYGIFIWILVYLLALPLLGFVANIYENLGENIAYLCNTFFEMMLWIWIIELTRRDLRNRITSERDPI